MARAKSVHAVAAPEMPKGTKNLKVHQISEMSAEDVRKCIARPRVDFGSILKTVSRQRKSNCVKL